MTTAEHHNTIGRALRTAEKWIVHHQAYLQTRRPIRPYLLPFLEGQDRVRILDVGAGIVPTVGRDHPLATIDLVSCDWLAREFREVLDRWKLTPDEYVEYQDMRQLTYADDSFDIVHCSNALDHTDDPRRAILEMIRVCRGVVYLRHVKNVGELERYTGLHRWNIQLTPDAEDCEFWNSSSRFLLSQVWPGFENTWGRKIPGLEAAGRVVSVLRKPGW
jgi:SAM-dependent methyltransferase